MTTFARYCAVPLLGLGLLALTSCRRSATHRSDLDILPGTNNARDALDKALTAWKDGKKVGKIQGDGPGIEVVDSAWQAGRKLSAFEILQAEEKPGPRWFLVKLTLKDAQPQQVRYAVLGLDPLWVYREEDYNQALGMGR